jgi:hypothetical protein
MARAFAESVVVCAAGEGVAFVFGAAVAFGEADALGVGVGEADFFVAAEAATGAQQASAAMQAVIRLSLFFIGWIGSGNTGCSEFEGARQLQL